MGLLQVLDASTYPVGVAELRSEQRDELFDVGAAHEADVVERLDADILELAGIPLDPVGRYPLLKRLRRRSRTGATPSLACEIAREKSVF